MRSVETRIIRIFNTYGPRMRLDDGRALPAFLGQALRGQDITVFGDGSQTRSFCYVDDLIEGLIRLMNSNQTGPINIGNPNEFTMLQLAQLIRNKINPSLPVIKKTLPEDDPMQRKPIIDLAKTQLGWESTIELDQGLDHTISYFKERIKIG